MMVCRSCAMPILWVMTESGKRMPMDPTPASNGNLIYDAKAKTVRSPTSLDPPGDRYLSHFASCPNSKQHRKEPT